MSDHKTCLVIFCKRPALYQGKQRLAKTIGAQQTYIFARSFLDCALEDACEWDGPVVLSPATTKDNAWANVLMDMDYGVHAQSEGCLGYRLQTIDQKLRVLGQNRIIFIGTDAPMLTSTHYEEARMALNEHDVVLSPASDGGVTIMGTRQAWPDMTGLPWSTERLGSDLGSLCRQQGYRVKNMSPSYDIDVAADLVKLQQDLVGDPRPARQILYQQINEFLSQDEIKYG